MFERMESRVEWELKIIIGERICHQTAMLWFRADFAWSSDRWKPYFVRCALRLRQWKTPKFCCVCVCLLSKLWRHCIILYICRLIKHIKFQQVIMKFCYMTRPRLWQNHIKYILFIFLAALPAPHYHWHCQRRATSAVLSFLVRRTPPFPHRVNEMS